MISLSNSFLGSKYDLPMEEMTDYSKEGYSPNMEEISVCLEERYSPEPVDQVTDSSSVNSSSYMQIKQSEPKEIQISKDLSLTFVHASEGKTHSLFVQIQNNSKRKNPTMGELCEGIERFTTVKKIVFNDTFEEHSPILFFIVKGGAEVAGNGIESYLELTVRRLFNTTPLFGLNTVIPRIKN